MKNKKIVVRVGLTDADIIGNSNVALQAAVDYVGNLGGGTVLIGPGVYHMEDSLHLRAHVCLQGAGEKTVLRKNDGAISLLATDGDYGDDEITLVDDIGLRPGSGVTVAYEGASGFHTTVATVVEQLDRRTFRLNKSLVNDYVIRQQALAQGTFPPISGYDLTDVQIKDLVIEGNGDHNPLLGGCRGAGIFFYRVHMARISGVTVNNFNGDGISYQQSHDVVLEDCFVTGCGGHGLHPGSGSQRTRILRCVVKQCARDGMYVCWRVRHSLFEGNQFLHNGTAGISIGHKDTDNLFSENVMANNERHGVIFRNEPQVLAAHRNRLMRNRIVDNKGSGIHILGETNDLEFIDNVIAETRSGDARGQKYGVYVGDKAGHPVLLHNEMSGHLEQDVFYAEKSD